MSRGFTLLELLIAMLVIGLLMIQVLPSMRAVTDRIKMERLAKELSGFVLYAKSEAVLRRERLWIHLVISGASNSSGEWYLELTNNPTQGQGATYAVLSGSSYAHLTLSANYTSNKISFDETHGRPKGGRFTFYPRYSPSAALNVRTFHRSGIVRVCSLNSLTYLGYERC